MHSKLEIEYKVLITNEQFNTLLKLYPHHLVLSQNNTYYDTTPSLKLRGMGCRIRTIHDRCIFTLKVKQDKGHEEIEFDVPTNDIELPIIQDVLRKYNIENLLPMGFLFTRRHLVELEHAELCIDYNEYNDQIDYEVEYELKDPSIDTFDEFLSILNSANIPYVPNKRTKIQRCFESRRNEE